AAPHHPPRHASLLVAIHPVALPVMMLWVINYRQQKALVSTSTIAIFIIFIAILIIILQIMSSVDLVPTLK
ncbi:hypothetical protein NAI71_12435, partial [Francisella tularensis subsp. holarctica]|nr:hypothetical protein [Francisella tularensis subsp. holarctica]